MSKPIPMSLERLQASAGGFWKALAGDFADLADGETIDVVLSVERRGNVWFVRDCDTRRSPGELPDFRPPSELN